jgi:formate C-acetyltransferase
MKYSPMECSPENVDRFGSIVQAYMDRGGQQIQFNIQDYKTLKEAMADPDSHPHLLVRVSGYSAYFKSLNKAMQEELITRSQYNLSSGEFVSL